MGFLAKKLRNRSVLQRVARERLSEPLHLNAIALGVAAFGKFEQRVAFDLVLRPHNAWGILRAAQRAKVAGLEALTVVEFGVASGAGLLNMAKIAESVTRATGVQIRVVGFDSGAGMPQPRDYRDHPDLYGSGDFPMDEASLRAALPPNCTLCLGDIADTVRAFAASGELADAPIGYVVLDVDYYSSSVDCLRLLGGPIPTNFLPVTTVFVDDVYAEEHNSRCGELLAIAEFNRDHPLRLLEPAAFLPAQRVFRRAQWLQQIYFLHVLDHPLRMTERTGGQQQLANPYLPRPRSAPNVNVVT